MSPNKRIFLNIVATYGRSLYALAIGLFTGRWVLMALGESDYGLYGVVAGLTVFIAFFNGLLASSIARFFAYSIGQDQRNRMSGGAVVECNQWFNTALMIHTVVPTVLMAVGYPIGVWAVEHWLTIPTDRIEAFVWVFRCVCVSCFVSMVNVPFAAMYTAKQYIAELTIYGVVGNTLQACFLYYIASHPSDWLVRYAVWTSFLAIAPQLIICLRAIWVFPECRINLRLCWDWKRLKQLSYFAGSLAFGCLGGMLRGQGMAILVNKYFGPVVNAAMSVANSVNGHSSALVAALQGAFTPAIVQACGAGDDDLMRKMAFRACKFGVILVLIFAVPLGVEIDNVMNLWLKTPPAYSSGLCLCMLACVVLEKCSVGHMIAVNAKGKVAVYQFFLGGVLILTLPVAWLFVEFNLGVYSIGIALVLMQALSSVGRVWFARGLVGMRVSYWFRFILAPLIVIIGMMVGVGLLVRQCISPSFLRLCLTTLCCEAVLFPLSWFIALDKDERMYVLARINGMKMNLRHRANA